MSSFLPPFYVLIPEACPRIYLHIYTTLENAHKPLAEKKNSFSSPLFFHSSLFSLARVMLLAPFAMSIVFFSNGELSFLLYLFAVIAYRTLQRVASFIYTVDMSSLLFSFFMSARYAKKQILRINCSFFFYFFRFAHMYVDSTAVS